MVRESEPATGMNQKKNGGCFLFSFSCVVRKNTHILATAFTAFVGNGFRLVIFFLFFFHHFVSGVMDCVGVNGGKDKCSFV